MPFDFYFEKQVNVKKKKKYENCTTYFTKFYFSALPSHDE
jgi:hypothetical protein